MNDNKSYFHSMARCLSAVIIGLMVLTTYAQDATPTPGIVNLSPLMPTNAQPADLSVPTAPPTQVSLVRLEAKDFANVRSEPSTESATLGQIRAGDSYTVLARYAAWIQFQFPASPNGRGWVFGELIDMTGDTTAIPEIDPYAQGDSGSTSALDAAIGGTPATILTVTGAAPNNSQNGLPMTALPTFTYPPGLAALAPTADNGLTLLTPSAPVSPSDTPPIVPILILGGLGLAGLAIGSFRK
ncbi:MAG: SH3 domain-containing protein [Chloroflexota bacterium]|nr:SH3 domain-containing protein [Chloroflexota bacterium]